MPEIERIFFVSIVPKISLAQQISSISLKETRLFNTGNVPWETSVTLLNTVSHGKRAISHGKKCPV